MSVPVWIAYVIIGVALGVTIAEVIDAILKRRGRK